jgi:hypothetical protein
MDFDSALFSTALFEVVKILAEKAVVESALNTPGFTQTIFP